MEIIVLAVRFILEVITVLGLLSGVFIKKNLIHKIIFFILSVFIILLWARYGAPKSRHVLIGLNKFMLEIFVYSIGTIGFYYLFGSKIGTVYLIVVGVDLGLMYALGLQGK